MARLKIVGLGIFAAPDGHLIRGASFAGLREWSKTFRRYFYD
jgi:hypothetical protein